MANFKLRGKCKGCKRTRWFLRKHKTLIAGSIPVMGRDLLCKECRAKLDKLAK